jgi:hypothetical protein
MHKKSQLLSAAIFISISLSAAFAQDSLSSRSNTSGDANATTDEKVAVIKDKVEGLNESYLETKSTVDALKKIKVSGYIQAQYQVADVMGVLSLNSVKSPLVRQAFYIKRGRLKTTYDAGLSKYVLELDATQDGVGIKDAFASFTEPWMKALSLTVGSMDRPFGYEVSYSSSQLESPERSKVIGYLFPKEKDLGAMLEFSREDGALSFLNVKAGVYNGMTNILNENNDYKDVIGRIGFKAPFKEIGFAVDGGFSGYQGKVVATDSTGGGRTFTMDDNSHEWAMTANQKKAAMTRQYIGGDIQLFYATPGIGGTCIKGEYIQGKHPTKSGSDDFYNSSSFPSTDAVYNRKIMGWYAYFIQNIDPVLQLVVKYDYFDPNTKAAANDFTTSTTTGAVGLTAADLAWSTWGFGVICYVPWSNNVRCMAFYEIPKNEKLDAGKLSATSSLYKYTSYSSATNVNLLTLRVQYKF